MDQNVIMTQESEKLSKVNVKDIRGKLSSKTEVYNFLEQDCGVFLPKFGSVNIYFLK